MKSGQATLRAAKAVAHGVASLLPFANGFESAAAIGARVGAADQAKLVPCGTARGAGRGHGPDRR